MFRKTVLAVAATAVIAVASLTPASAHGFHHGFGFGGFGLGLGLLGASIAASTYAPAYDSCWQPRQIVTRHGYIRTVMVNVCE
jgi:hypothetical protein